MSNFHLQSFFKNNFAKNASGIIAWNFANKPKPPTSKKQNEIEPNANLNITLKNLCLNYTASPKIASSIIALFIKQCKIRAILPILRKNLNMQNLYLLQKQGDFCKLRNGLISSNL